MSSSSSSSFVKFKSPVSQSLPKPAAASVTLNIPGCKTSLHNNQLLSSIGIPSIDYFIGGGLPVGSVCLISEDTFNYYSDIICRCFIAEGILNKHAIYIANPFAESTNLLARIPNVSTKESDSVENEEESKEKLKTQLRIAWRYGDSSSLTSSSTTPTSGSETHNYFLLNKYMNNLIEESSDIKLFQFNLNSNNFYRDLATDLNNLIDSRFNVAKLKQFTNIVRIVINTVGSAFWNENDKSHHVQLFNFLLHLRNTLRHSLGVCLVTIQHDLLHDASFMSKLSHLSDYVFLIDDTESVQGRLGKTQYEGLFKIHKLPRLNTLNSYLPETLDLAFYIKRKRLIVEILHLPPDIGEDDTEKKGRTSTAALACGSVGPSKLDF